MHTITTIGLDIAKSVFQVHGIDAQGKVIIRLQLKRRYVLAFFQKFRRASLELKPAPPVIIGRANSRLLGIRYASCRRLMQSPMECSPCCHDE
jgi:transposase